MPRHFICPVSCRAVFQKPGDTARQSAAGDLILPADAFFILSAESLDLLEMEEAPLKWFQAFPIGFLKAEALQLFNPFPGPGEITGVHKGLGFFQEFLLFFFLQGPDSCFRLHQNFLGLR